VESHLTIKDLSCTDRLDRPAMSAVRGGMIQNWIPVDIGTVRPLPTWPACFAPNPFPQPSPGPLDPGFSPPPRTIVPI
jgi:hypothetical protein